MSKGEVEKAVVRDIRRWGAEVAGTALAAVALNAARTLDDPRVTPTPRSMLLAQLRETMLKLAEMAPEQEEEDGLDELRARRASRLA